MTLLNQCYYLSSLGNTALDASEPKGFVLCRYVMLWVAAYIKPWEKRKTVFSEKCPHKLLLGNTPTWIAHLVVHQLGELTFEGSAVLITASEF